MKRNGKIEAMTWRLTPTAGKTAALYVRVSSADYGKGEDGEQQRRESVPLQIERATAYAVKQGWTYKLYAKDCDISGMESIKDRPSITELIKDIEAGKIHTVIFRAIDRLFRNKTEGYRFFYDIAKPHGINIISLTEPIDVTTTYGEQMLDQLLGQAQTVPLSYAKCSRDSKDRKAKAGSLRTKPPLGYAIEERDGIRRGVKDIAGAAIVKEIFTRYVAGEGFNKISRDFAARGVKGKSGGTIYCFSLKQIITNALYKGELVYNGVSGSTPYPAIIDNDMWATANAQLKGRSYKGGVSSRNKSLLAGLLKCGYCHDKIRAGDKARYDFFSFAKLANNHKPYHIYRCATFAKLGKAKCNESITLKADMVEPVITNWLKYIVENKSEKGTDLKAAQAKLEYINAKLEEKETLKQTLAKMVGSGAMDEESFTTANAACREEKTSLEADRADISATVYRAQTGAESQIVKWDSLSVEQKREAIKSIIKAIYVYSDKIRIDHVNGGSNEYAIKRGAHGQYLIDRDNGHSLGGYRFSNVPLSDAGQEQEQTARTA